MRRRTRRRRPTSRCPTRRTRSCGGRSTYAPATKRSVRRCSLAANMPMDFVWALEELFASEPHTSLDLEENGIDHPLTSMKLDDEHWAVVLESLEVRVAAIDRVAAVVEA